jgi:heterodisulfide reductase subunit B
MNFAFFRGCTIPIRYPHIEAVSGRVLPELDVNLIDIPGFACCPEPVGFGHDKLTWLSLAARNISLAEHEGLDILTLCNGCSYSLKQTNHTLKTDEELRLKVNEILAETDHQFDGKIEVKHFANVLLEDIGLDAIQGRIERPLEGLQVASHTGCHIVSPTQIMNFDDPFAPIKLDSMISTVGATPADYDLKPLCCGWTLTNYGTRSSANELLGAKLVAMNGASADCITVLCPQCYNQFDTGQLIAARSMKLEFRLPVLFYTQLLALGMGYSLEDIHYRNHRIKDKGFEEKIRGLK